jgi:hypothetical protein
MQPVTSSISRTGLGAAFCGLGASLLACGSPVGPLPSNADAFTPPSVYARWWAMTEACSGRVGHFRSVRWYRAPGSEVQFDGRWVHGYWSSRGNLIVVPDARTDNGSNVRHEMLHALLRVRGHPRDQFLGACAGIVDCSEACAQDAGAWSVPTPAIPLTRDSLVVTVEPRLMPLEHDGQRWLTLRVRAQNPLATAVLVMPDQAGTFGYIVSGPAGERSSTVPNADLSTLSFAALETKEWLFDFHVAKLSSFALPPGEYFVRGGFAGHWGEGVSTTITP